MKRQMKRLCGWTLVAALTAVQVTSAQNRTPQSQTTQSRPDVCDSDRTADLQQCFEGKFQASEKKLNAVYQQLMDVLKKKGDPDLINAVQTAERLWVRSRETDCNVYRVAYAGGSFSPLGYTGCRTLIGIQRASLLESFVREFSR